jgi:transcriptional regulator with XRE-family HTH domain
VTSAQIRAARGLLDWTVRDVAERSGVHRDTVSNIETGAYAGAPATLEAIRRTLEYAGIELTNGEALLMPSCVESDRPHGPAPPTRLDQPKSVVPSLRRLVLVGVPSDWSIPSATRNLRFA